MTVKDPRSVGKILIKHADNPADYVVDKLIYMKTAVYGGKKEYVQKKSGAAKKQIKQGFFILLVKRLEYIQHR